MTTETTTTTTGATAEEKINQLRELFADAPEVSGSPRLRRMRTLARSCRGDRETS
jgi:hypothetical protein